MKKTQNERGYFWLYFLFLNFEFVSDFDIRISDLCPQLAWRVG
jgi:hypothetical protein